MPYTQLIAELGIIMIYSTSWCKLLHLAWVKEIMYTSYCTPSSNLLVTKIVLQVILTQLTFTCAKLTIEALEIGVKYFQS